LMGQRRGQKIDETLSLTRRGYRKGTVWRIDKATYKREWRAAHPEYRERERLRSARRRAQEKERREARQDQLNHR
jgi:hypothetical protein